MQQHFESFRDPVSTIRRSYEGPFNNRIDRFPASGTSFRVEGVAGHVLKTNCFITEDMQITRSQPKPTEVEFLNNGDRVCRNGYTFLNRCMFAMPDYPGGFPTTITNRCVEPEFLDSGNYLRFTRFPLNKTFDNVRWRTENSRNSHRCNIFDTIEMVPWLTSAECRRDIERSNKKIPEIIWYDYNTSRELTTEPNIPNFMVPLSHKRRITTFQRTVNEVAAVWGGDPLHYTIDDINRAHATSIDTALLFLNTTDGLTNQFQMNWDSANRHYTNAGTSIQNSAANLDPFSGITNANNFWQNVFYYTPVADIDDGYDRHVVNQSLLFIREGDIQTTPVQPDGYCYFGGLTAPPITTNNTFTNKDIPLYVVVNDEYQITNLCVTINAFRVALGAGKIDLQIPTTGNAWHGHCYHNFVQPKANLRLDLRTGANVAGKTRGDLYDGNLGVQGMHKDHNESFESGSGRFKPHKFARIFYDTPEPGGEWLTNMFNQPNGNMSVGFLNHELTPWCIEFDLTTEMGNYLFYYWREQSRLPRAQRTDNEYWRAQGGDTEFFTCLANTSFHAEDVVNNIRIDPHNINSYRTFLINAEFLTTPGDIGFVYENVNENGTGRLYFRKQIDANGLDTTRDAILWNGILDPTSETFFEDADTAIATNNQDNAFQQMIDAEPAWVAPTGAGTYNDNSLYVRLRSQGDPGNPVHVAVKALFEQYNGIDNRSVDLYMLQPDPTQVPQPIIPYGYRVNLHEPFFSVGSAKGMFPCKRPFDITGAEFPLLIQDYRINFRRRYDRFWYKTFHDYEEDIDEVFGWNRFYTSYLDLAIDTDKNIVITDKQEQRNLQLITSSQDSANQEDKSISAIEKYVPKLDVYASQFVSPNETTLTQKIYCDKGFPSFLFLRMEWSSRERDPETLAEDIDIKRLPIQSVVIKLFGLENPFVSKLLEADLYHICRKNCHKYCDFKTLWNDENALLLTLEDIGLWGEQSGYPNKKRFEFEIRVTWKLPDEDTHESTLIDIGRTVQLRTVFVNENHYLRGDRSQTEFYEVF